MIAWLYHFDKPINSGVKSKVARPDLAQDADTSKRCVEGRRTPVSELAYDVRYVFEICQDQAVVQGERPTSRRQRRPKLYGST